MQVLVSSLVYITNYLYYKTLKYKAYFLPLFPTLVVYRNEFVTTIFSGRVTNE